MRRLLGLSAALATVAALLIALERRSPDLDPVSFGSGPSAFGVYAPKGTGAWTAHSGGFTTCLTRPGQAVITGAELIDAQGVLDSRFVVRRVTGAAHDGGAVPIYSATGVPEKEAGHATGVRVEPAVGAAVARECPSSSEPDAPFTELMVVLTTGEGGATVRKARVEYTFDGEAFETELDWTFRLCGRSESDEECGEGVP